jgi:hypothetical protein
MQCACSLGMRHFAKRWLSSFLVRQERLSLAGGKHEPSRLAYHLSDDQTHHSARCEAWTRESQLG